MKKLCIILLFLFIIISINTVIFAQEEAEEGNNSNLIRLKADHMIYEEDKIIVEKNVKINRDKYDLSSPYAEIYRDEDRAILKEGVEVLYDMGDVKSREMTAYFEENRFIFEKEVLLNHELENGNIFNLEAPFMEMFSEDNSFNAKDGVIINYNERILKSELADYDGEKETLVLTDKVRIEEEDGWIESNKAEFDLSEETETFTADGEVELEFETN